MNTGTKQAIVAYKIAPDGQPVDVDDVLTSISGKKQAIAVLEGYPNPNENLYEIEFYFAPGSDIEGTASTTVDMEDCPVSKFSVSPEYVALAPDTPTATAVIYSSYGWILVGSTIYATVSPSSGGGGSTTVTITRTTETGEGDLIFKDTVSGELKYVRVLNMASSGWILDTGFWDDAKAWIPTGVWNY